VTAERIRDKIAASKAKGMWMGGTPPLGYAPDGRSLSIVPDHAKLIRHIYARYLEIGNVRLLADELAREGTCLPTRTTSSGRSFGGGAFTRGQLYRILSNTIYIGEISHGTKCYAGLHNAIIDQSTWEAVQTLLAQHVQGQRQQSNAKQPSPLAGLIYDHEGQALVATHAVKQGRRYRYYVSRALQHGGGAKAKGGMRIPARDIEALVTAHLAERLSNPLALLNEAGAALPPPDQLKQIVGTASNAAKALNNKTCVLTHKSLIDRLTIHPDHISITTKTAALIDALGYAPEQNQIASPTLTATIDASIKRSGMAVRMVLSDGTAAAPSQPDQTLIRTIARANRWWQRLTSEPMLSTSALAASEGVTPSYLTRVLRLAFLDPKITEAVIAGKAPASLTAKRLTQTGAIPICWSAQRTQLGINARRRSAPAIPSPAQ
jgi:site-specific DNA recombinase